MRVCVSKCEVKNTKNEPKKKKKKTTHNFPFLPPKVEEQHAYSVI